jgi:uncharacterized protein with ATP-grasp and redox domains
VLATNDYPPAVVARLEELLAEIPHGQIRLLHDAAAPDAEAWISYIDPHLDRNWLEVPWFFAEVYFYRRILEATGYFATGPGDSKDPFAPQKQESLESSWTRVQSLAAKLAAHREAGWAEGDLSVLLAIALWGNQGDLSMWPGGSDEQPGSDGDGGGDDHRANADFLLADEREVVARHLQGREGPVRVDFIMDNAGFELVSDLALADYFLGSTQAKEVNLHLKADPLFVSDALIQDVHQTVDIMAAAGDQAVATFGGGLQRYLEEGRLKLTQHRFWNSPLPGWEMPADISQTLAAAALVVSKGDANYRRLLGDRHWAFTTPFARIVSYFPAPLLALRTLKSDLAAGIAPERIAALKAQGVEWTTSGRWGVIQFAPERPREQ